MKMNRVVITAQTEPIVANLNRETVNLGNVGNRRFMYNPKTGTLILGSESGNTREFIGSHAEEFHDTGIAENFDDFVRGWIGFGGHYKHGIIHFAPSITKYQFNQGYDSLLNFSTLIGVDEETKVRGFMSFHEVALKELIPNNCKAI